MVRLASLCLVALAGCAQLPDVERTVSDGAQAAAFPVLAPLDPLLAAGASARISPEVTAGVDARAAGLRARAASLRGPVIEPTIRRRMDAALRAYPTRVADRGGAG